MAEDFDPNESMFPEPGRAPNLLLPEAPRELSFGLKYEPLDAFRGQAEGVAGGTEDIGRLMKIGFLRESSIANLGSMIAATAYVDTGDRGFDPYFDPEYTRGYEDHIGAFAGVRNRAYGDHLKRMIDREREELDILQNSGGLGFVAGFAGAVFDPSVLLPIGRLKATIAAVSAEEMVRQSAQVTRTGEEAFLTVGATALVSGIVKSVSRFGPPDPPPAPPQLLLEDLRPPPSEPQGPGGTGGPISREGRGRIDPDEIVDSYNDVLRDIRIIERETARMADGGDSVGAQRAPGTRARTEAEERELESLIAAAGAGKLPDSPLKRILISGDLEAREAAQRLVDNPYFMKKHLEGIVTPQSVESNMRQWWWPMVEKMTEMNRQYDLYRGGVGNTKLLHSARRSFSDLVRGTDGHLSIAEFRSEVGKALHMGDKHGIPEVAASAQELRKLYAKYNDELIAEQVYTNPLRRRIAQIDEMVKRTKSPRALKVLKQERRNAEDAITRLEKDGPQPTNAESYASILWKHDVIKARETEFKLKLREHFASRGMKGDDLEGAVEGTFTRIIREAPFKKIDDDIVGSARSLKERTLDIDPRDFFDFMETDAEVMLRYYTRTVSADLELTRAFGSLDLIDEIQGIKQRYAKKISDTTSPDHKAKLERERDRVVTDMRAMRDRLRGNYGLPEDPFRPFSRFVRGVKQFNYTVMLGGVVISSFPDMARLIMTEGLDRAWRDAFHPLITNMQGLRAVAREGKFAGTALEMELGFRAMSFADVGDTFSRHSKFERFLQGSSDVFSLINLFSPWNAAMKGMASSIVSHRIIEDVIFNTAPYLRSRSAKMNIVKSGTLRTKRLNAEETANLQKLEDEVGELDFNIRELEEQAGVEEQLMELKGRRDAVAAERDEALLGRRISGSYDPKTNTVNIDEAHVDESYARRAWHGARVEGVDSLTDDLIRNKADWREFIVEHELAHADHPQLADELHAPYENRINKVAANRMLTKRYRRATKRTKFGNEKLLRAGIDEPMADRIARQWEQHGEFNDELIMPNSEMWTDLEARNVFRNALGADVDRIIVTPGAGDLPLWVSTEVGSLVGQFKSFSMASAQKVMVPGIQQRDMHVGMGVAAMVGMGMMVDEIKRWQFDIPGDPSMTERIMNGIDRSGILGYFTDLNNVVEKTSDNHLGLSALLGVAPPFKPSFRSKAGAIGGPTAGQLANIAGIMTDTLSGNYSYHTAGALRRTIPGHTVLWLNPFYDTIEQGARF